MGWVKIHLPAVFIVLVRGFFLFFFGLLYEDNLATPTSVQEKNMKQITYFSEVVRVLISDKD